MHSIYTQNQSKDKIRSVNGFIINTITCFNANDEQGSGVTIQLTGLESMWYNHEENINHPEGSEYPVNINVPFMKLMRERIANSVLARTGYDIRNYDNVIHASISPGRNPDGSFIDQGHDDHVVRNV